MAKVLNKTKGFGSISRDCVYDNELSDRARFLYVYMACKPESWEFYQDKVAEELGYKKDTLRKYLDELITRGWITELEQHNDGKFGCLEYIIEIERCDGNLPIRKKTDTEKTRNGKNHNQRNIDSISSDISISSDKRDIEEKSISNDIPKNPQQTSFLEPAVNEKEVNYNKWLIKDFPRIVKMKEPLSYKHFCILRDKYGEDMILSKMEALDNDSQYYKKKISAYRTLNNWCREDSRRGDYGK